MDAWEKQACPKYPHSDKNGFIVAVLAVPAQSLEDGSFKAQLESLETFGIFLRDYELT